MTNSFKAFEGEKVAIVHDRASSLPDEYRSGYRGLLEVPFKITASFNGVTKTWEDDPLKPEEREEFLYFLQKTQPLTSMPNVGDYTKAYEQIIASGITEIGVIPMSDGPRMSGSQNSAKIAAKELIDEDKANIVVFNSKTVSIGQGLLINQADVENRAGNFNTADELIGRVKDLSSGLYMAQAFSDLDHLEKGGRIGKIMKVAGGALHIVPIIGIGEDGGLKSIAKKREWKRAHRAIIEHVAEGVASHDPDGKLGNIAVRLAFIEFESKQIDVLRSKVMGLVQQEADNEKEKEAKFKPATGVDGKPYDILRYKEGMVTATYSGLEVCGLGGLVTTEMDVEQS